MNMKPTDASFDDENTSELQGAQLYTGAAKKKNTSSGAAKKRPEPQKRAVKGGTGARYTRTAAAARQREQKPRSEAAVRTGGAAETALAPRRGMLPAQSRGGIKGAVTSFWKQGLLPMIHEKNEASMKTVKEKKKKPLPVSALFMAVLCTGLLMFMIVSYVQINEYTLEVSNMRSELSDMMSQDKALSLELEKKNDMLTIEQKAEELGMVKVDQLTKKHITLTQEDKIEVVEPEPTEDSTVVTTMMSGLWQNFSGLWEYLQ